MLVSLKFNVMLFYFHHKNLACIYIFQKCIWLPGKPEGLCGEREIVQGELASEGIVTQAWMRGHSVVICRGGGSHLSCFQLISSAAKSSALMGFLDVMIFQNYQKKIGKNTAVGKRWDLSYFLGFLARCLYRIWRRFPPLWHYRHFGLDPALLWEAVLDTVGWFAASRPLHTTHQEQTHHSHQV